MRIRGIRVRIKIDSPMDLGRTVRRAGMTSREESRLIGKRVAEVSEMKEVRKMKLNENRMRIEGKNEKNAAAGRPAGWLACWLAVAVSLGSVASLLRLELKERMEGWKDGYVAVDGMCSRVHCVSHHGR